MARYLAKTCPRCKDRLGVIMIQRSWKEKEILINALCAVCGYNLKWRLIYGGNREKTYRRIGQKRHRHAQ